MAASNFDRVFALVLKSEGGYVDHPQDPGGCTNLGVTIGTLSRHRGHPCTKAEVRALTSAAVAPIYRKNYWDAVRADELPAGLDYAVFDLAVNSGPARAARLLQAVLGCPQDGVIGPATVAASCRADPAQCIRGLSSARLAFLRRLPGWAFFARGWRRRVEAVEGAALALARTAPAPARSTPAPARSIAPSTRTPAGRGFFAWLRSSLSRPLQRRTTDDRHS